ncbi:MAG: hypothetical protein DRJ66_03370 [Thermoprotei archaeon]|nr:MAG: hypothetical protein DRJ66_03370 [Thermoprotei archaeon]RLF19825.1 MAG: hypothetical protein DRZ82_04325 [Thermoprotei archaeon]
MIKILKRLKYLIKDVRASPLIEEGMLIGLSLITLTMLLSMVTGIFGGLKGLFGQAQGGATSLFNEIAQQLDKIWQYIVNLFK